MIKIRAALKTDAEICSQILCTSIRELCVLDHHNDRELMAQWTANKTPEHMIDWIASPLLTLILAFRNGHAAGVGCCSSGGEVLLNYVAPVHRFCNVSQTILVHLEAILVEHNHALARLTSTRTAQRFYQKAGWEDVGTPEEMFGLLGYPMQKEFQII